MTHFLEEVSSIRSSSRCAQTRSKMRFTTFKSLLFLAAFYRGSQATECAGSATYKLTFTADWTAENQPKNFPANDVPLHFSTLVGCTHNISYNMWKPGKLASTGVKNVAEQGTVEKLNQEVNEQIDLKTAYKMFNGSEIKNTGSVVVLGIKVTTQYPLVSVISMIAPSPDWFVGVHDYSLCDESTGKWSDRKLHNLSLYDSGTDSASTFVHTDTPTIPPVPVSLIEEADNEAIKPFGRFVFEKTHDSSSEGLALPTREYMVGNGTEYSKVKTRDPVSIASHVELQCVFVFLTLLCLLYA